MIIKSLTKLDKGKTKICLDNGTDFCLYKGECNKLDLKEGGEISPEDYEKIVQDILLPRCEKRGLHLLEKQDRSEKNLRDKLKEGGYPSEVLDQAMDYIKSFGYIDDERLANNYIHFYQDTRSRRRITQDLIGKGISIDIIERCLEEEYVNDEQELIAAILVKKHYDPSNATYEEKGKMYRFLAGRGFSSEAISKALRT